MSYTQTIQEWSEARQWAMLQLEDLREGRVRLFQDGCDITASEIVRLQSAVAGLSQLLALAESARREADKYGL